MRQEVLNLVSNNSIPFISPEKVNEMNSEQLTKVILRYQKQRQRVINESVVTGIVKTSGFVSKVLLNFDEETVDQATDSILKSNYTMNSAVDFLENVIVPNYKLIGIGLMGAIAGKIFWDSLTRKSDDVRTTNDSTNDNNNEVHF